jgi:gamma-glutamylcyclotransferase (GGCT)/AIG2-like uncharacterized protein YtfP
MNFIPVFVYGTLMTEMGNHHLVAPFIADIQRATVKGLLYHLPFGYPAMLAGEDIVWGELPVLRNTADSEFGVLEFT